jgi:hypothetical protein
MTMTSSSRAQERGVLLEKNASRRLTSKSRELRQSTGTAVGSYEYAARQAVPAVRTAVPLLVATAVLVLPV